MNAEKLKKSILQMAVEGKLVPQNPQDEPASELLKKIRQEKEKLIAEGTIKKDKNPATIYRGKDGLFYEKIGEENTCIQDELPFDIPDTWEWVRLSELLTVKGGKRIPKGYKVTQTPTKHIYIRVTDMKCNSLVSDNLRYINEDVFAQIKEYTIGKDDLYLTIAGTIGNVGTVPEMFDGMNLTENAVKLTNLLVDKIFLMYQLLSPMVQTQFVDKTNQVAQPKLAIVRIKSTLIPLPPLEEQKRIVAKLEEVLPEVERFAEQEKELAILQEEFPERLKKSVLQMAVEGKLVPQNPQDEPASELLKKIRQEKEKLIAEGTIKKDKNPATIYRGEDGLFYEKIGKKNTCIQDELPFNIPDTWEWVRVGEVCEVARGGSPRPIKNYLTERDDGINWIKIGDTEKHGKYINATKEKIIQEGISKSRMVHKGDFLLTNSMSFGRPYILNIDGCIHDGWLVLSGYKTAYDIDFLYYLLSSTFAYMQFCSVVSGAVVKNLNIEKVSRAIFPLPPLEEQKRIVAKLEEVLPEIEKLQ